MLIINFADTAKEILEENREYLNELVTKPRLTTNTIVNEAFKWIHVLAHDNEGCKRRKVATLQHPIQETAHHK